VIYPVTDYYARLVAKGVIKRGDGLGKKICLTFDDGPDPMNTPELLEILKTADIPAVFFLVGRKAERHPELVRAIGSAGHEIGAHTYYHRHAYSMFLKQSLSTIIQGLPPLENITGKPPVYFRPPWGALNLFEYLFLKKMRLKIVLWTANAADWDIRTSPEQIVKRLQTKVAPGSIIVLHDSGGDPGAPRNTLKALPGVIAYFQNSGYRFVSLQEICSEEGAIPSKGRSIL
jgi:peptidoglycan/xylan/chitin deacetylase (PgdA/CDA1 family)